MKKTLILSALFLLMTAFAGAQSFLFYQGDQPLEDNAELTVSNCQVFIAEDDYTILSMESDLYLKNVTGSAIQATVTQTILEGPSDGEKGYLSFCFLDCTTGNQDRTKNGSISANSFSEGYHVNFYVYEGVYNRVKVKYEVYKSNDISRADKKTVTVTYMYDENSNTGIQNPVSKPVFNVFQEGNRMKFDCTFSSNTCQLEIYNLMGQKLAHHSLTSGNGIFTLPEQLSKGYYLCILKNKKGTIAKRKFIVK